jgi:predicted HicB family RNase H-like nuclease
MKKGIDIDGALDQKGTTANVLNIAAASKGISLVEYIRQVLNDKAKALKK